MKYFDISPLISSRTAVFPGDVPYRRDISMDFNSGNHLLLSSIQSTLHIGAHADAPNHYDPTGEGIGSRDLKYYFGPAQVIQVETKPGGRILVSDLAEKEIMAPRILFYTGSFRDPESWRQDFVSLSPDLVDYLADNGVVLVGIDTPSVDPAEDKILLSHSRIAHHKMAILEGIVLSDVPEGLYDLVALPLKLENADASPVRAILLKQGTLTPS